MVITVRQRQYAIGLAGTGRGELVTENIWTCTGFLGIDDRSGVAFLCHLNTPWCAFALPEVVADLRKHVTDLCSFRLYTVAGIRPELTWGLILVAGVLMVADQWSWGLAFLAAALMFSITRLHLRYQLWRLKAFGSKPISLGHSSARFGFGMCGVRVDPKTRKTPEPYSYGRRRDYERFKEPKWWGFRMTKAEDSA